MKVLAFVLLALVLFAAPAGANPPALLLAPVPCQQPQLTYVPTQQFTYVPQLQYVPQLTYAPQFQLAPSYGFQRSVQFASPFVQVDVFGRSFNRGFFPSTTIRTLGGRTVVVFP